MPWDHAELRLQKGTRRLDSHLESGRDKPVGNQGDGDDTAIGQHMLHLPIRQSPRRADVPAALELRDGSPPTVKPSVPPDGRRSAVEQERSEQHAEVVRHGALVAWRVAAGKIRTGSEPSYAPFVYHGITPLREEP